MIGVFTLNGGALKLHGSRSVMYLVNLSFNGSYLNVNHYESDRGKWTHGD